MKSPLSSELNAQTASHRRFHRHRAAVVRIPSECPTPVPHRSEGARHNGGVAQLLAQPAEHFVVDALLQGLQPSPHRKTDAHAGPNALHLGDHVLHSHLKQHRSQISTPHRHVQCSRISALTTSEHRRLMSRRYPATDRTTHHLRSHCLKAQGQCKYPACSVAEACHT
jgi:hypothetical protein